MDIAEGKTDLNIESELTNLPFPDDFRPEEYFISNMVSAPTIPDGGIGWLCVIGCFIMNFVVDGVNGSLGIVLPLIQDHFHSSIQDTTLILSMLILFVFASAPFSGLLLDKFKTRTLVITFGLVGTLSISLSYFVNSVKVLIFTFGVLPGMSFNVCVISIQVMISLYFDKRRTLAYSITAVGTGIGSILLPLLTSVVIKKYGFSSLYFFWGVICFLLAAVGPLNVPLKLTDEQGNDFENIEDAPNDEHVDESAVYMRDLNRESMDYGNSIASPKRSISHQLVEVIPYKIKKLKSNFSLMSNMNRSTTFTLKPNILRHDSTINELGQIYSVLNAQRSYVPSSKARGLNHITNNETSFYNQVLSCYTGNATFSGLLSRINEIIERSHSRKRNLDVYSYSEGDLFRAKYGQNYVPVDENPFIDKKSFAFLKKWIRDLMVKPMNRTDIFYKGSRKQLMDQRLIDQEPNIRNIIHVPKIEVSTTLCGRFNHILSIIFDWSIFKDKCLIIYYIAVSLFSWATYIPLFFIVLFAQEFTENATYLPSVIGGGTVVGQFFCGLMASYCGVGPILLSEFSFYTTGLFIAVISALDGHFYPMAVVCMLFGFSYGIMVSTWQSILCEIVGLQKLTSSISFYLFFRGLSIFAGLYTASIISGSIGIGNTFYLSSGVLGLSAIVHSIMRIKLNRVSS